MDGLLLVNKPEGWTSFDVVARIRGILRQTTGLKRPKVGHTGTLDPMATGLLILVLGTYCKRASEFSKLDKVYEVQMTLGQSSTTGDAEGELHQVSKQIPSQDELESAVASFVGEISQVPPLYSAIKIGGQRAYDLARKGKEVKLEPRAVKIYDIAGVSYKYPLVTFSVAVSSGTYIRSLVGDIGTKLGTAAYMSALRRVSVGAWLLGDAAEVVEIDSYNLKKLIKSV